MSFIPTNFSTTYEFATLSPPDVGRFTRVVGICGISSVRDNLGVVPSDPSQDGWYHSQFYLLHHLLMNQGLQQRWITAVSPEDIVENYGQLSYPDTKGTRRVVLDRSMLQCGAMWDVTVVEPKSLRDELKTALEIEVMHAMQYKEPLLILIIGHGYMKEGGIHLHNRMFTSEHLNLWTAGAVDIGVVTPNPFTGREGGWLVMPSRRLTNRPPHSNRYTQHSLAENDRGRSCGSVWMVEVLSSLDFNDLVYPKNPVDKEMHEKMLPELHESVYDALIGGNFKVCGVSFDYRTDAWEIEYRPRLGKTLIHLKADWFSLRSISPPDDPTGVLPQSLVLPTNSISDEFPDLISQLEKLTITTDSEETSQRSPQLPSPTSYNMSFHRKLLPLIAAYRRSLPGWIQDRSETLIDVLIRRVEDSLSCPISRVRSLTSQIEYRLHLMELADRYVSCLNLQVRGRSCSGFDMESWKKEQTPEGREQHAVLVRTLADKFIFPATIFQIQGRLFPKPWEYLSMVMLEKGILIGEFERDLGVMLNFRDDMIRAATSAAKKDSKVLKIMKKIAPYAKEQFEDDTDGTGSEFDGNLWVVV